MTNLEMVETLREKANVSYEEAKAALEASNWDLLDAILHGLDSIPFDTGGRGDSGNNLADEPIHIQACGFDEVPQLAHRGKIFIQSTGDFKQLATFARGITYSHRGQRFFHLGRGGLFGFTEGDEQGFGTHIRHFSLPLSFVILSFRLFDYSTVGATCQGVFRGW